MSNWCQIFQESVKAEMTTLRCAKGIGYIKFGNLSHKKLIKMLTRIIKKFIIKDNKDND